VLLNKKAEPAWLSFFMIHSTVAGALTFPFGKGMKGVDSLNYFATFLLRK
jgi:hypothetical protein